MYSTTSPNQERTVSVRTRFMDCTCTFAIFYERINSHKIADANGPFRGGCCTKYLALSHKSRTSDLGGQQRGSMLMSASAAFDSPSRR